MDSLHEGVEALQTAENRLRALLMQAAEKSEYDSLPKLADWAKQLNSMLSDQGVPETTPALPQNGVAVIAAPRARSAARSAVREPERGRRTKAKKREYPKFVREGDSLVKIGWSKSEGKTYEHKAPRSVLRRLVQVLLRAGAAGSRFVMDGLLPLKGLHNADIPDYQTYLTLAWLKRERLIVQHGRQGYSLRAGTNLPAEAERLWDALPSR